MDSLIEKVNRYDIAIESVQELIEKDNETTLHHFQVYLKEQRRHVKAAISDENKTLEIAVKDVEFVKAS